MSNLRTPCSATSTDRRRDPQVVAPPTAHDGIRRALRGSFGSFPAIPEEFARLLERLD